MAQLTNYGEVT